MAMKKSYLIAGVLAVGLVGWLASGQVGGNEAGDAGHGETVASPSDASPLSGERQILSVRVQDLTAETIEREIVINGKTAPVRSVEMRAETNGRVIGVDAREGAFVAAGDVIIRLDPRDREVLALEAEALLRQRQIELDAAKKLGEKGFQAETSVALAEANFAAAEAALKRAQLDLDHTKVAAPFAGVLDRRHVEIGAFVDIGDPLAMLLDQDPYLVTGDVTETEVAKLEVGMTGKVRLATGDTVEGKLRYVASQADQQTRTFEVELEVPNPAGRLAAGVSAEIRLSVERLPAHQVSPSVLTLADDGTLGVKTVDAQGRVVFMPVEIAKADQNDVWLIGLPEEVRLIVVGQGFVTDGAEVRPMPVDDSGNAADNGQVVSEAVR
ncbi:MAG: efflux RND transporter periplasmic adaptor subunit [Pseudomonadota bacterium]